MPQPLAPRPPEHQEVSLDTFAVLSTDDLLCATLDGALAVCLYDAVQESGAMLHIRIVPPGGTPLVHELTDELLASDLLLLERCLGALRRACPNARHWQAKAVVHCGTEGDLATSGQLLLDFVRAHFSESKITVVQTETRAGSPVRVQFRPAMGQLRIGS